MNIIASVALLVLTVGCAHTKDQRTSPANTGNGATPPAINGSLASGTPTVGDDGIERWPATVGGDGIQIRLARTRSQHFRGLAGVRLKPDEGMLFIYRTKVDKSFWMKDCVIGLDIAWLSEDLRILRIDSLDAPPPDAADEDIMNAVAPEPIRYVLEMRKGWFASHGLKSGARVSVPEAVRRMKGA